MAVAETKAGFHCANARLARRGHDLILAARDIGRLEALIVSEPRRN